MLRERTEILSDGRLQSLSVSIYSQLRVTFE